MATANPSRSSSQKPLPNTDLIFEKARGLLEGKEDPAKVVEYLKNNWKTVVGMIAILGIQAYLLHNAETARSS